MVMHHQALWSEKCLEATPVHWYIGTLHCNAMYWYIEKCLETFCWRRSRRHHQLVGKTNNKVSAAIRPAAAAAASINSTFNIFTLTERQ